jgi:hypothetical protein
MHLSAVGAPAPGHQQPVQHEISVVLSAVGVPAPGHHQPFNTGSLLLVTNACLKLDRTDFKKPAEVTHIWKHQNTNNGRTMCLCVERNLSAVGVPASGHQQPFNTTLCCW